MNKKTQLESITKLEFLRNGRLVTRALNVLKIKGVWLPVSVLTIVGFDWGWSEMIAEEIAAMENLPLNHV